jgi:multidrug efflux pump subunit AcrA (membrane-fusion protein)
LLLAISIFIAVLLIPLTYRVNCECELQPVFRRFVAAPHDGILEKTLVKSGDTIAVDQVIALLDGRKLRIELSGIRANYDGAKKRRESALALGNIAESQIASSEMNRFQSKIEILEQQLTQLEVRSPIHGLVLNGDLEKAEGAPLEMGQTLFEIAPLTEMVAEISIPESEIQYVKSGMPVTFKLNAFPLETWSGKIEHIHPCTEIVDTQSVFVARVRLPNAHNQFRPGMQGSAKIKTKKATLGWNLFHQGWESLRYWTIW